MSPAPTSAATELCLQPLAGSQLCLPVCAGEREGRSGAGGVTPGTWGSEHPCAAGPWAARGEGSLQDTCMASTSPCPNWGCGGLQLPARSCVIALTNLVGQSPSSLPPLQTLLAFPPWVHFLGVRIKEEEGTAQRSYPNCITVLWGPIKLLAAGIKPRIA